MATSELHSFVIQDAPPQPDVLRMTLKRKSMWKSFLEKARDMTPQRFMEFFDQEKKRLLDKVKNGGTLTQEECDFLNKNTRKKIEKVINDFKERVLTEMEINPTDTADEIEFKSNFAKELIKWFKSLLFWLLEKIKVIFSKIKESIKWCTEKAKELFEYLWSLF